MLTEELAVAVIKGRFPDARVIERSDHGWGRRKVYLITILRDDLLETYEVKEKGGVFSSGWSVKVSLRVSAYLDEDDLKQGIPVREWRPVSPAS